MSPEDHQKWRLKKLNFWRDRLEERMAGVNASIAVLEPETLDELQLLAADINGDDSINVLDLVLLISIILEV